MSVIVGTIVKGVMIEIKTPIAPGNINIKENGLLAKFCHMVGIGIDKW